MKRGLIFGAVLLLGVGALWLSERRKAEAPVSPDPILYLIADTERELSRVPARATRLSDAEEIRIGDELAQQYGSVTLSDQDRAMQAYLDEVGARVVVHTRRQLPYRFHYLPYRYLVNAFSLPGGHVYIGAGLIELMNSEDELAAVLGHEVEHIDLYHCVERYQVEARMRRTGLVGGLVQLPLEVFQAGYSKDQELEADREGTRLAVEAGYSPFGAIQVFESYQHLRQQEESQARSPQEEAARMTVETLSGYFRSHPLEADRIEQIRRLIASEHWEDRTRERPLRVRYQPPPDSGGH